MAWHPMGWRPSFFSEIDPFPRAVLQHHYPDVPLHGDFTTIEDGDYDPIDLLVGGTPCQSFSVAGLRGGLDDDRGNLALEYLRLASRLWPSWLVWENVPGVLSSNGGRDFGSILGGMVELGYGVAYRVLDAQYVRTLPFPRAVPQRRRRVFVVGYLGDWRRAAAVLFEREGLHRDPPPRREAGKIAAPTLAARTHGGGGLGTDFDLDGGLIASDAVSPTLLAKENHRLRADSQAVIATTGDVAGTICANSQNSLDAETETIFAFAENSRGEIRLVSGDRQVSSQLTTGGGKPGQGSPTIAIQERAVSENPDAGPDGAGFRADGAAYTLEARGTAQAVAFDCKGTQVQFSEAGEAGEAPTLRSMAHANSHQNAGGQLAIATPWMVRRLTPTECERLQGFPDGFTNVPWRGKDHAPDGRRYKALGNSMAVNVMQLIGSRIAAVEAMATPAILGSTTRPSAEQ